MIDLSVYLPIHFEQGMDSVTALVADLFRREMTRYSTNNVSIGCVITSLELISSNRKYVSSSSILIRQEIIIINKTIYESVTMVARSNSVRTNQLLNFLAPK